MKATPHSSKQTAHLPEPGRPLVMPRPTDNFDPGIWFAIRLLADTGSLLVSAFTEGGKQKDENPDVAKIEERMKEVALGSMTQEQLKEIVESTLSMEPGEGHDRFRKEAVRVGEALMVLARPDCPTYLFRCVVIHPAARENMLIRKLRDFVLTLPRCPDEVKTLHALLSWDMGKTKGEGK